MERGRQGAPASSLLTVAGQAGLEGCGFHVVGEVMGCIVEHIGWDGWAGCGYYGYGGGALGGGFGNQFGLGGRPATVTSGGSARYAGFGAYADALYAGYDTALLRMLTECQALGGDGVVGVKLTVNHLGNDNREFLAYGTAVRSHGATRPRNLFSTTLPGQDVAKLLHGGWVPAGIVVGLSVAIRHDDWATLQQASLMAGNVEVSGYSELVHHVRVDARQQFHQRTGAYGADGSISSSMGLDIWEREVGENHRDHVALASMIGTAVARFHDGPVAPTESLKILPLDSPRRSK
jgi:uncharacterized protein YbjQ (UPF0145 family)